MPNPDDLGLCFLRLSGEIKVKVKTYEGKKKVHLKVKVN